MHMVLVVIREMAALLRLYVKSCSQDAVLTFLIREFVNILPYLTAMVSASLAQVSQDISLYEKDRT